ncbi:PREDICTED: MAP7 domain-containing protein 1-like [Nicotiana attenuata]|uniref:MAP7 domain-containing protein 1-like n=1 Tax=Nicotiana attenuata TaxID=49451 RepID=UPI0009050756|nr:PREDICTED: MAP7 domain-containing protein 1-like [Nicotiana attenuata]
MRPVPPREETESPILKSRKDSKRKRSSTPEDPQDRRAPTRRLRRKLIHVDIDSVHQLKDEEEEDEGEESALVTRARKPVEAVKPSKPETLPLGEEAPKKSVGKAHESPEVEIVPLPPTSTPKGTSTEIPGSGQSAPSDILGAMTIGHSPPIPTYYEEAIRKAQALQTPDPSGVPGEEDPFRDCFTGVDDAADLNNASTLFEEAHRPFAQAITRFRAEQSQCKAELKKSLAEGKLQRKLEMIGQLRGEVDQVKADCNQWKENMDRLAAEKEAALAQLALAETQLWGAKVKNMAQAKKIDELEAKLATTGAEVAEARAEKTKATTEKTVAVYLRDAEAAQMELREASNREKRSNDIVKCQSWRETLEEIQARGFNLTEEIAQAKALEADAKFLVSSNDDDDEGS